jgi:hypothetical protein
MKGRIHIQAKRPKGEIYKYAVEMGSGDIIYIRSFINIGSGIQRLMEGEQESDT